IYLGKIIVDLVLAYPGNDPFDAGIQQLVVVEARTFGAEVFRGNAVYSFLDLVDLLLHRVEFGLAELARVLAGLLGLNRLESFFLEVTFPGLEAPQDAGMAITRRDACHDVVPVHEPLVVASEAFVHQPGRTLPEQPGLSEGHHPRDVAIPVGESRDDRQSAAQTVTREPERLSVRARHRVGDDRSRDLVGIEKSVVEGPSERVDRPRRNLDVSQPVR